MYTKRYTTAVSVCLIYMYSNDNRSGVWLPGAAGISPAACATGPNACDASGFTRSSAR